MIRLSVVTCVVIMAMDLADGTTTLNAPSHPVWAVMLFFAASLMVLFLALETSPPNPVTILNTGLLPFIGYLWAGSIIASLVRSALRFRLDVDTAPEALPVLLLSTSVFVVVVNLLARLLRPQKS